MAFAAGMQGSRSSRNGEKTAAARSRPSPHRFDATNESASLGAWAPAGRPSDLSSGVSAPSATRARASCAYWPARIGWQAFSPPSSSSAGNPTDQPNDAPPQPADRAQSNAKNSGPASKDELREPVQVVRQPADSLAMQTSRLPGPTCTAVADTCSCGSTSIWAPPRSALCCADARALRLSLTPIPMPGAISGDRQDPDCRQPRHLVFDDRCTYVAHWRRYRWRDEAGVSAAPDSRLVPCAPLDAASRERFGGHVLFGQTRRRSLSPGRRSEVTSVASEGRL